MEGSVLALWLYRGDSVDFLEKTFSASSITRVDSSSFVSVELLTDNCNSRLVLTTACHWQTAVLAF